MTNKEMYRLAYIFRKTSLWNKLTEMQLFAVALDTDTTGYCSVTGAGGEHFSLTLYVGERAFETFRDLLEVTDAKLLSAFVPMVDCIQVSYESKDMLSPLEEELARKYADELNIIIKGKNAFPVIKRHVPKKIPWEITDERDVRFMSIALECALEVAARAGTLFDDFMGKWDESVDPGTKIPLIVKDGDGFIWKETTLPEHCINVPTPTIFADETTAMKIKKLQKHGVWEGELVVIPEPVDMGDGEVPVFPEIFLFFDTKEQLICPVAEMITGEDEYPQLIAALAHYMRETAIVPCEIRVKTAETFAILEDFCNKTGIKLIKVSEHEFLDEVIQKYIEMDDVEDFPDGEDDFSGTNGSFESIVEMLNSMSDEQFRSMPPIIIEQTRALIARGVFPESLVQRFDTLIRDKGSRESTDSSNVIPFDVMKSHEKVTDCDTKSYIISVAFDYDYYRHFKVSANTTLLELHNAIYKECELKKPFKHVFYMDNSVLSDKQMYTSNRQKNALGITSVVSFEDLDLKVNKKFKYECYIRNAIEFTCRVVRTEQGHCGEPVVVKRRGDDFSDNLDNDYYCYPKEYSETELSKLYRSLKLPTETIALLREYFEAFVNLYGMISVDKAHEIYNSQNEPILSEKFVKFCEICMHDHEQGYSVVGMEAVYSEEPLSKPTERLICDVEYVFNPQRGAELLTDKAGKPYYIPPKEELLKYSASDYFTQTPQYLALDKLIKQNATDDRKNMTWTVYQMVQFDEPIEYFADNIERFLGKRIPGKQVERFVDLFKDLSNNVRKHKNCGYTSGELAKMYGRNSVSKKSISGQNAWSKLESAEDEMRSKVVDLPTNINGAAMGGLNEKKSDKVGRNDKCPCGSGKKYKNCCLGK